MRRLLASILILALLLGVERSAPAFNASGKQPARAQEAIERQVWDRARERNRRRVNPYQGHLEPRDLPPPAGYLRYTVREIFWGSSFLDFAHSDPDYRSPYDEIAQLETFYSENTITEVLRFGLKLDADPNRPPKSSKLRRGGEIKRAWIRGHTDYYRDATAEIFARVHGALDFTKSSYSDRKSKSSEFLKKMYADPMHGNTIVTVRERKPGGWEPGEMIAVLRVATNYYQYEPYWKKWEVPRRRWSRSYKLPQKIIVPETDAGLRWMPNAKPFAPIEIPFMPLPLIFGPNGERSLLVREVPAWDPQYSFVSARLNLRPLEEHFNVLLPRPLENGKGVLFEPGMWSVRKSHNVEGFAETWLMMLREFAEADRILPGLKNRGVYIQADKAASRLYEQMGFHKAHEAPAVPPEDLDKPADEQSQWWIMTITQEQAKKVIENLEQVKRGVATSEDARHFKSALEGLIALEQERSAGASH